jgi:hypothetical protein
MDEWQSYLVSFDTDRIKQYLFTTNRLKEIRGGSALLCKMDQQRKESFEECFGNESVVYSAGGGAAILVPDEEAARKLIAEIEQEFRAVTTVASITGVFLPPEPANERKLGKRMEKASECLRRTKAAKAELSTLPVEPYTRLCSSCGRHPVTELAGDGSGDWLCCSCAQKRCWGAKGRPSFFNEFAQQADPDVWMQETMPDDLDSIGAVSSPPNYVGFIALDGNHISDLLSKPATVEEYRLFSEELWDLTKHQTFSALEHFGRPRGGVTPFEIVLVGGDDVLLITAADVAIEIALAIADGFEKNAQGKVLKKAGLTMASGVVLAHADLPIPAMHTLAEDLQKSAKRYCATQGYKTGALDFLVVSGSDVDLEEMRRSIPHRRPYTLEDMQRLLKYIRDFKAANFPTGQLQTMYQALFTGEVNAQLASIATLGYLGRRENKKQYDLLRGFFQAFGVRFDGQLPPWDADKRDDRQVSALTDLVELYPFVSASERGSVNDKDEN